MSIKFNNRAKKLAQVKQDIADLQAEEQEILGKFSDKLEAAMEKERAVRKAMLDATAEQRDRLSEAFAEEKRLREDLAEIANEDGLADYSINVGPYYIGTMRKKAVRVTRFASVPQEFRLPPEKCLDMKKVKAADKVPGVTWDETLTIQVRG